ncbi:MAG: DUF3344 domain-containing protein [Methanophagales archaeon]|nr:DUF3344 domain-containing protein [Methanophagales archaeon]
MRSHSIFSAFVLALIIVSTAGGSYAGDKTLNTISHDEICGGVFFTLGDSEYSGRINYNETYTVNFDTSVLRSGNKEVKLARLYVYWVWSQKENVGVYPTMEVEVKEGETKEVLSSVATYTDTKGFVGKYDYFSGVYVYNCNFDTTKTNQDFYSVTVKNVDANGSTFCVQGIGSLVIYECQEQDEDCQCIEYWVSEGCDMIYAEYGIAPEMKNAKCKL